MKDRFVLGLVLCSVLLAIVSGKTSTKSSPTRNAAVPQPPSPAASVVQPDNDVPDFDVFNWNLCKALRDVEKSNAVISSISVKLVLLVLYEGAQGATANQIERVLGLNGHKLTIRNRYSQKLQSLQSHDKNDYELDIGTKLFMDISVHPKYSFLQSITKLYNASYEVLDFSKSTNAVNSINQWAENITHGRIQQLITEAETKENTVLLLLNAIFFKGFWTNPFNKDLTKFGTFNLNSTTKVEVPLMMTISNFKISTIESLNSRLISLPYEGNKFVMYIILPNSADGLDDLINKINPAVLGESIKGMKMVLTKVVLPKFNFEYTSILGPILQKMGIIDMFELKANLTDLGDGPLGSLIVSNVLQKAGIEVNEQGSIAHAATEVELGNRFGGTKFESAFEVNRPFLFMIEDITMNTIVFVGQVTNPLSQGMPIVSIPVVNIPTQTKPESDGLESKINIMEQQEINFLPFTYFDTELFYELGLNHLDSNFVTSPASIKSILALLSEGAQGNTLDQLNILLRLPKDQSSLHNLLRMNQLSLKSNIIDLVSSNNIFVKNKNSVSNYFQETANNLYSANISEINSQNIDESIKMINERISFDTKGLINNIISKDDFDGNTELLLANVLYFKGNWFVEFNENETTIKCFYTKPSVCTEVNMMYLQNQLRYGYITDIKGHAVELLYEDRNMSMIILLPDENVSFSQFLKDLPHNSITKIINLLRQRNVNLYLPRFTFNYSTRLSTVLKKMGLTSIFDRSANLSSIFNPEKQVFVKDITHKATIEVNEKGSTASAATVISVVPLSSTPQMSTINLNVNRPFAFYIINRANKNTLFSGHVHNINSTTTAQQVKKSPLNIPLNNPKRPNSQTNEQIVYKHDRN